MMLAEGLLGVPLPTADRSARHRLADIPHRPRKRVMMTFMTCLGCCPFARMPIHGPQVRLLRSALHALGPGLAVLILVLAHAARATAEDPVLSLAVHVLQIGRFGHSLSRGHVL